MCVVGTPFTKLQETVTFNNAGAGRFWCVIRAYYIERLISALQCAPTQKITSFYILKIICAYFSVGRILELRIDAKEFWVFVDLRKVLAWRRDNEGEKLKEFGHCMYDFSAGLANQQTQPSRKVRHIRSSFRLDSHGNRLSHTLRGVSFVFPTCSRCLFWKRILSHYITH